MSTLLAVLAHPDDETFRCGGTLALLARKGVRVHLLTATRGEAGSCGDPPLCAPAELPALREQELRCACAALGIELPRIIGYPDGRLAEVDAEEIVAAILATVTQVRPQVLLTFGPDGLSGHPDHVAVGACAAEAFRRSGEIAALYTMALPQSIVSQMGMPAVCPVPDEAVTLLVDVSPVWEAKLAAMRCHATQVGSTPLLRAPPERQRLFFGTEYFIRAAACGWEEDLLEEMPGGPP